MANLPGIGSRPVANNRSTAVAVLAAVAVGVGGCSSGETTVTVTEPSEPTESPPPQTSDDPGEAAAPPSTDQARSGGIAVSVRDASTADSITYEGGVQSAETPDAEARKVEAKQGGRYVIVDTVVQNDTDEAIDLTCGFPVDAAVLSESGQRFTPISGLSQIAGNPECNAMLQPGFDDKMSWVFLVPPDATINAFQFTGVTIGAPDVQPARISLPDL